MFSVRAVCLVVLSNIASVMSSLTVRSSSVAVIGERVEMKCSVNGTNSAQWTYIAWNASTETNIYLGRDDVVESMRSRYKIDNRISGQRNLIIDSVDLDHAGRYKCSTAVLAKTLLVNQLDLTVLGLAVQSSFIVTTGERVELNCSVNAGDSTMWTYNAWDTSTVVNISVGSAIVASMRSRYKIEKSISEQYNLIIDSVDLDHAGRYRCVTTKQQLPNATLTNEIHLNVLGSHPECSVNITSSIERSKEEGYLLMWCRVIFIGNMIPIFSWTKDGSEETIVSHTATTSGTSRLPATRYSSFVRQLSPSDNGATFKCKITFRSPNIPDGKATDYEYTWSNTLYGPRNLGIVEYEDRLECSADGNPTPIYRWTRIHMKRSVEGPVFALDDKDQTFQCTATNVFASEMKNFTSTRALTDKKSVWSIPTIGLILITVTLAMFGMGLLGIGLKLRKLSIAFHEGEEFRRRSDPLSRTATIQKAPSTDDDPQMAAVTGAEYCALTNQTSPSQEPQIYCELRLND